MASATKANVVEVIERVGTPDKIRTCDLLLRSQESQVMGYTDRKSTRLNSSHLVISYAVFCLKKKNIASYAGLDDARLPHLKAIANMHLANLQENAALPNDIHSKIPRTLSATPRQHTQYH